MSAEEFFEWWQLPENADKRWELDRGEVVEMPCQGELHGVVSALVVFHLWNYIFRRGRGYLCCNNTGLIVAREPDTVRGPDIMLFDENRSLEAMSHTFVERVPNLVVEVLSPTDQLTAINRRTSQIVQRGVPLLWLVDPVFRGVTVYRPGQILRVLDETDEITGQDVLPDLHYLHYRVADFFALPGQGQASTSNSSPTDTTPHSQDTHP
jgi:Uma2 family endonuclease